LVLLAAPLAGHVHSLPPRQFLPGGMGNIGNRRTRLAEAECD
jgi:hypothetical protein